MAGSFRGFRIIFVNILTPGISISRSDDIFHSPHDHDSPHNDEDFPSVSTQSTTGISAPVLRSLSDLLNCAHDPVATKMLDGFHSSGWAQLLAQQEPFAGGPAWEDSRTTRTGGIATPGPSSSAQPQTPKPPLHRPPRIDFAHHLEAALCVLRSTVPHQNSSYLTPEFEELFVLCGHVGDVTEKQAAFVKDVAQPFVESATPDFLEHIMEEFDQALASFMNEDLVATSESPVDRPRPCLLYAGVTALTITAASVLVLETAQFLEALLQLKFDFLAWMWRVSCGNADELFEVDQVGEPMAVFVAYWRGFFGIKKVAVDPAGAAAGEGRALGASCTSEGGSPPVPDHHYLDELSEKVKTAFERLAQWVHFENSPVQNLADTAWRVLGGAGRDSAAELLLDRGNAGGAGPSWPGGDLVAALAALLTLSGRSAGAQPSNIEWLRVYNPDASVVRTSATGGSGENRASSERSYHRVYVNIDSFLNEMWSTSSTISHDEQMDPMFVEESVRPQTAAEYSVHGRNLAETLRFRTEEQLDVDLVDRARRLASIVGGINSTSISGRKTSVEIDRLTARVLCGSCVGWWDYRANPQSIYSTTSFTKGVDVCSTRELFLLRKTASSSNLESLFPHFAFFGVHRELTLVPASYLQSLVVRKFSAQQPALGVKKVNYETFFDNLLSFHGMHKHPAHAQYPEDWPCTALGVCEDLEKNKISSAAGSNCITDRVVVGGLFDFGRNQEREEDRMPSHVLQQEVRSCLDEEAEARRKPDVFVCTGPQILCAWVQLASPRTPTLLYVGLVPCFMAVSEGEWAQIRWSLGHADFVAAHHPVLSARVFHQLVVQDGSSRNKRASAWVTVLPPIADVIFGERLLAQARRSSKKAPAGGDFEQEQPPQDASVIQNKHISEDLVGSGYLRPTFLRSQIAPTPDFLQRRAARNRVCSPSSVCVGTSGIGPTSPRWSGCCNIYSSIPSLPPKLCVSFRRRRI